MKKIFQHTALIIAIISLLATISYFLYCFYDRYFMEYIHLNNWLFSKNMKYYGPMISGVSFFWLIFYLLLFAMNHDRDKQNLSIKERIYYCFLDYIDMLWIVSLYAVGSGLLYLMFAENSDLAIRGVIVHLVIFAVVLTIAAIISVTDTDDTHIFYSLALFISVFFFLSPISYPFLHGRL